MQYLKSLFKFDWFLGLLITLVFVVVAETGGLSPVERKAYDLGAEFSSGTEAKKDIVVVAIDDKSIAKLGAWPWPREVLAETTLVLSRANPRVIGYHLPLDDHQNQGGLTSLAELRKVLKQERKLSQNVNRALRVTESTLRGDDKLAASFKNAGRIVLGMSYREGSAQNTGLTPSLPAHIQRFTLPNVSVNNASRGLGWPTPKVTHAAEVFPPIDKFTGHVGAVGVLGNGEVFAGEPLVLKYGNEVLPSFALMVAARSEGLSGEDIRTRGQISPELDGESLGADHELRIYPRYYDADGASAFSIVSLVDILGGNINENHFRDKIVIVGPTSERHTQMVMTPMGTPISPTLAAAHTVSSLLNNEQFRLPEWASWVQRMVILVIGLYLMVILPRFRPNTALFFSLFLALMIFNAHFILMSTQSLWLPLMTAAVMLVFGHLLIGSRQLLNAHLRGPLKDLSSANRELGMALQAQGNLDLAFEKYRKCIADDALFGQVYNLGLDYERKRQFNKAVSAFKFIQQHNPAYNDVSQRIVQNEQAANTVVLRGSDTNGPGPNLISGQEGVQKPKLGRYQIDSEIGRGAMGMVYLGHDDKIGRTVAIKTMMLSDEIAEDLRDEVRTRFFREAEAAGRLDHPNIVTVYDVGEEQDLAYIAMDYLKGKDLTAYCTAESLLTITQVFSIISSIALALDYAHQQHVVHRDIKPANIIYDRKKNLAKITDFGVACLTDTSKTKSGTVLGSPSYMSPEQLAGKKVDGRADLFSLGVTMYQMLTGVLPFEGDSIVNLMYNITNEKHPDVRNFRADLPNCINTLMNMALRKDPEKRFQSGKQMARAIKNCHEEIRQIRAA